MTRPGPTGPATRVRTRGGQVRGERNQIVRLITHAPAEREEVDPCEGVEQMQERTLRVLVVDDEDSSRSRLRQALKKDPDFEEVLTCASGLEAVRLIREKRPDIVLMDVHLPELSGFEVVEEVGERRMPVTVFVTAHLEHAVRAFEVDAIDFLLKPIDEVRFQEALRRAKSKAREREKEDIVRQMRDLRDLLEAYRSDADPVGGTENDPEEEDDHDYIDRIAVKERDVVKLVPIESIDWIEAADDYVYLHVGDRAHLVRQSMAFLDEHLSPRRFFRIHRSTIVNLRRVQRLERAFHGAYCVILKDGTSLKMSRSRRRHLEEVLQQRI